MEPQVRDQEQKATKQRFETRIDGWVRDLELGIDWGPSSKKTMNFEKANIYCEKLNARLPTRKELTSIIDYDKSCPAINTDYFKDTKTDDWYWSGTVLAGYESYAWCVGFYYGDVGVCRQGNDLYVRPVRASQ